MSASYVIMPPGSCRNAVSMVEGGERVWAALAIGNAGWHIRRLRTALSSRADAIISWNFKHIVRLDRIRGFNSVNLREGYGMITILSPKEVNLDEQ